MSSTQTSSADKRSSDATGLQGPFKFGVVSQRRQMTRCWSSLSVKDRWKPLSCSSFDCRRFRERRQNLRRHLSTAAVDMASCGARSKPKIVYARRVNRAGIMPEPASARSATIHHDGCDTRHVCHPGTTRIPRRSDRRGSAASSHPPGPTSTRRPCGPGR